MFDRNTYYDYKNNALKDDLIIKTLHEIASSFNNTSLTEIEQKLGEISSAIRIYQMAYDDNPQLQEIADLLTAGR